MSSSLKFVDNLTDLDEVSKFIDTILLPANFLEPGTKWGTVIQSRNMKSGNIDGVAVTGLWLSVYHGPVACIDFIKTDGDLENILQFLDDWFCDELGLLKVNYCYSNADLNLDFEKLGCSLKNCDYSFSKHFVTLELSKPKLENMTSKISEDYVVVFLKYSILDKIPGFGSTKKGRFESFRDHRSFQYTFVFMILLQNHPRR